PSSVGQVPIEPGCSSTGSGGQVYAARESSRSSIQMSQLLRDILNQKPFPKKRDPTAVFGLEIGTSRICLGVIKKGRDVKTHYNLDWVNNLDSLVQFEGEYMHIGQNYKCKIFSYKSDDVCGILRLLGLRYDNYVEEVTRFWPFSVINVNGWPEMECDVGTEKKTISPETSILLIWWSTTLHGQDIYVYSCHHRSGHFTTTNLSSSADLKQTPPVVPPSTTSLEPRTRKQISTLIHSFPRSEEELWCRKIAFFQFHCAIILRLSTEDKFRRLKTWIGQQINDNSLFNPTVLFEIMNQYRLFAENTIKEKEPFFVISVAGSSTYNQKRAVKRAAIRAKLTDAFLVNDTTALILSQWFYNRIKVSNLVVMNIYNIYNLVVGNEML
ncbi:ATPase with role in protein import into the ER, partial [Homalodisca vitripennis]